MSNIINDEEIYTKKSQLEHILLRPDTYVGSTENNKILLWIYDELHKLKKIEINSIDALFKIYDEVLVNASDNSQNDKSMEFIKVYINDETNEILINPITGITTDSRDCEPGDLYIALLGERSNGHHYLSEVDNINVSAVLISEPSSNQELKAQQIIVEDTRKTLSMATTLGWYLVTI